MLATPRVLGCIVLGLLFTVLAGWAKPPAPARPLMPSRPDREHFCVDDAALISIEDRATLDGIASRLLSDEKIPVVVVTIRSLAEQNAAGYTIERYAQALFDHWGVGSDRRDYGMLLLVSKGDRQARIELGAAWGRKYDAAVNSIMQDLMVPQFRRGDMSRGIVEGVRGLDALARGLALPSPRVPWTHQLLLVAALVGVIATIVSLFRAGRSGWGWALIAGLVALLVMVLRSAASQRGSGGAFGGGRSGGGGATGSW